MNETPKSLFSALLKAQAQMGGLVPDSTNPHLKNKYASLAAVLDVVQGPLREAGLVLYQSATFTDGTVVVMSSLIHPESGEAVQEQLPIPVAQQTAQAIGGAITYGRRYLAMAMCGLAPDDDDDGTMASQGKQLLPARQQPQRQPAPNQPAHRAQPAPSSQSAPEPLPMHPEVDFGMGEPHYTDSPPYEPPPPAKNADAIPTVDEAIRINALEIIEAANLKTPGMAQSWAVTNRYRTNEHSARNAWMGMITEHFGGASLRPPQLKEAIVTYIELCLLDGKKEPVTA